MCNTKPIGMRNVTYPTLCLLVAGLALLAPMNVARAQSYALTDLGTLGGTNCLAYAINNREQVVGTSQTLGGNFHAFMFDGGRMMDQGTLGGSNSWAYGINDNGWTVGASEMPMGNRHGFLSTNVDANSSMMDLGTGGGTNSAAWMINMHNEMVGWTDVGDGSQHGFFMTNAIAGSMMDLGTAGGIASAALCINSNRMIVGYSMMTNGSMHPIMSTNALLGASGMMMMGMGAMGSLGGQSSFVNDMGMVVGQAEMPGGSEHAFASLNDGMMGSMNVDLGTLGGSNSVAYCVNNAGVAVGAGEVTNGMPHGFVLTNALSGMAQMMDLNGLIPTNSGWEMMEARGINQAGQIVGWGMHNGQTNAFLLTPVSGPVMMTSPPSPQVAGPGDSVTLHMGMSSSEPLSYQWLHDGVLVPGATNATLTLPGMGMLDAGRYTVTARNAVGTVANASVAVGMFMMTFANGAAHMTVGAPVGSNFRIERSDMLGTGANWQPLSNFTMTTSIDQMSDTPPRNSSARFYRAVMPK